MVALIFDTVPEISVIVPNYNHARFLRQRIDSILNQTYQDFELILLDDCSTDNSRGVLESYSDNPHVTHIVYNERNSGSAFMQWDKGIQLSQGNWIWIAESDDWAEPDFLKRMASVVAEHPSCGLVYCLSYRTNEQGELLWTIPNEDTVILHQGESFIRETLACYNAIINSSSCIFKRSLFKPCKTALYERMRLCGDWFFYVLLAEQADVAEIKSPLNYCRRHEMNISECAEAQGLTFLEGADVLDYILAGHRVKESQYSKFWGRQWAKYKKKWLFSREINTSIRNRFREKHKAIIGCYYFYTICIFLRGLR